jgi:hypothetical protein
MKLPRGVSPGSEPLVNIPASSPHSGHLGNCDIRRMRLRSGIRDMAAVSEDCRTVLNGELFPFIKDSPGSFVLMASSLTLRLRYGTYLTQWLWPPCPVCPEAPNFLPPQEYLSIDQPPQVISVTPLVEGMRETGDGVTRFSPFAGLPENAKGR